MGCDRKWLEGRAIFFKPLRFIDAIKDAFCALENRENAHWTGRYMREKYPFIGIEKPERALVFKEIYKKQTDVTLLSTLILSLNTSKEFFIQKAIGWSLRQYARTDPEWVLNFLIITH